MKYLLRWSWAFFVLNFAGDPQWYLQDFVSKADCDAARTWIIEAHFKTVSPDATLAAQYASPCFQRAVVQQ